MTHQRQKYLLLTVEFVDGVNRTVSVKVACCQDKAHPTLQIEHPDEQHSGACDIRTFCCLADVFCVVGRPSWITRSTVKLGNAMDSYEVHSGCGKVLTHLRPFFSVTYTKRSIMKIMRPHIHLKHDCQDQ